jgi:hypothetical protein
MGSLPHPASREQIAKNCLAERVVRIARRQREREFPKNCRSEQQPVRLLFKRPADQGDESSFWVDRLHVKGELTTRLYLPRWRRDPYGY